jgi:O-antigen/teichoic acid export membrane protein
MSVEWVEGCSTREGRERLIKRLWGIVLRLVGQQAASERSGSATLLKHSALYLFARGLPGLVAFLSIAIYTRLLSPEAYGQYVLVVATVGLCNSIVFCWLRMGLLRFLPAHLERPQALLSTLVTAYWWLVLGTGGLAVMVFLIFPEAPWKEFVPLGVLLLWAQAWFELNLELVRSRLAALRYLLISLVKAVLALGLGALLIFLGLAAYGPLLGLAVGMVFSALALTRGEWNGVRLGTTDPQLLRSLLGYGLPLTATFALAFVIDSSDRLLIGWRLGADAAGLYAAGYDLAQGIMRLLMITVYLASYPIIVHALEQEGLHSCQQQLQRNLLLLLAVALPAATGLAVLAPNIARTLLPPAFQEMASQVIPWIALAVLFSGVKSYYLDLSFYLGRYTLGQMWIALATAIVNVAFTLWWIPKMGPIGAVYATLVAYFVAFVLSMIVGHNVFPLPFPYKDTLKILVASGVMGLLLWLIPQHRMLYVLVLQTVGAAMIYIFIIGLLNVAGYRKEILGRLGQ